MMQELEQRMREIAREEITRMNGVASEEVALNEHALLESIASTLRELGIRPNLSGYRFMKEALEMVYGDIGYLRRMTSQLYPDIAEKFGTTPSRVERALRHAIETAWHRGNGSIRSLMGGAINSNNTKPTNTEFIAAVVENLKLGGRLS